MPTSKLFVCILFLPLFLFASSASAADSFTSLSLLNLTLLGDAYLRDGLVGLTRDVTVPSSSSGFVVYPSPVRFFDPDSNTTASFSTRFTFSISSPNPNSYGDGLAFFLSPDNETLGSPGGFLGLVNSSQLTQNRFIAIEFDTQQDPHFGDPGGDHVGLDISSLGSIKTADPSLRGIKQFS